MISSARELHHRFSSRVGVRLKVGDKFWEEWRGAVWGGAVPSPVGGLGACPQKKNNFVLKIMQFWASFGTSFLYYSIKGGLSPSPKSGGPIPAPPLLRRLCPSVLGHSWLGDSNDRSFFGQLDSLTCRYLQKKTNRLKNKSKSSKYCSTLMDYYVTLVPGTQKK